MCLCGSPKPGAAKRPLRLKTFAASPVHFPAGPTQAMRPLLMTMSWWGCHSRECTFKSVTSEMMLSAGRFPRATNVNCCLSFVSASKTNSVDITGEARAEVVPVALKSDRLFFQGSKLIRRLFIFVVIWLLLRIASRQSASAVYS